jgi:hypothetical protein
MSEFKFKDYNRTVTSVIAVAQGPDGKPALMSADKPAGSIAERAFRTNGKITEIRYYRTYDPVTKDGEVIATKNIRWDGDNWEDSYWS